MCACARVCVAFTSGLGERTSMGRGWQVTLVQEFTRGQGVQGWAGGGVQQRRYLQLPVSAHYVHFPLVSPPLIADFPEGLWSGQIEKFSCSFSVSRRQCYKADEFSVYYSFMTAPVCLWD